MMSIPDPISGYHTEAGSGERGAWSMEQRAWRLEQVEDRRQRSELQRSVKSRNGESGKRRNGVKEESRL
ncbi:hypothetical protein ACFLZT_00210 [Thermodesulfobacteriota bacterium]